MRPAVGQRGCRRAGLKCDAEAIASEDVEDYKRY